MNRGELEGKLWELCVTEREIIWNWGAPVGEVIKLGMRRQELMDEILDGFLRIHTVVNRPAEEALAEKRAWAAAWKKAAKLHRDEKAGIVQDCTEAMRQYDTQQRRACWAEELADWQMKRAIKAEEERDEARAQLTYWYDLLTERGQVELMAERDEARAECTRLADQLDGSPWAGVLEQRDEARAECTELYECWQKAIERLCERVRAIERLCERLGYS